MPGEAETYAAFYDYRATGLPGDVDFYLAEARQAGGPVLELGCGTGRILIPIAEAGLEIVGLDLSPPMLEAARQKAARLSADVQQRITLVEGDMRSFALGREFALIIIPYRAFLHLLTPHDQRQALARIHAHLQDGGRLVFNVFDPNLETIAAHTGPLGSALKTAGEFTHPETQHRFIVWDTRQYDPAQQTISMYFILEELDPAGRVLSRTYLPLTLRYIYRHEIEYLLELSGFEVEALYGDFERGPFKYGGEQVWLARKRAR